MAPAGGDDRRRCFSPYQGALLLTLLVVGLPARLRARGPDAAGVLAHPGPVHRGRAVERLARGGRSGHDARLPVGLAPRQPPLASSRGGRGRWSRWACSRWSPCCRSAGTGSRDAPHARAARLQRGGADRAGPRRAVRLSPPADRAGVATARPGAGGAARTASRSWSSTTAAPTTPRRWSRRDRRRRVRSPGGSRLPCPARAPRRQGRRGPGRDAGRGRRPRRLRRRRHGDAAGPDPAARRGAGRPRRRPRHPDPARRLRHAGDASPATGACSARRSTCWPRCGSSARSRTPSAGSRASPGRPPRTCSAASGSRASCSTSS